MGRIRTVKPELFKHEELLDLELETGLPIRLAFIGLFTVCDRDGRFKWRPRALKSDIFPYEDIDFSRVLHALATRHFIRQFTNSRDVYGWIPSWHKHQAINGRESASQIPSPEDPKSVINEDINTINNLPTRHPRVIHASSTRDSRDTCMHVGKGREGKGKEGKEKEKTKAKKKSFVANAPVAQAQPCSFTDDIQLVFEFWKKTMGHSKAKLDDKRKSLIRKSLKAGYDTRQLCQAITGCSMTPHNMGDNDRKERYDGLHVILRDADQIDRFMRNATPKLSDAERWAADMSANIFEGEAI